jgi:hypothetical protein
MHIIFWLENLKGRYDSEKLGVDRGIILELILGNRFGECELDTSGSG